MGDPVPHRRGRNAGQQCHPVAPGHRTGVNRRRIPGELPDFAFRTTQFLDPDYIGRPLGQPLVKPRRRAARIPFTLNEATLKPVIVSAGSRSHLGPAGVFTGAAVGRRPAGEPAAQPRREMRSRETHMGHHIVGTRLDLRVTGMLDAQRVEHQVGHPPVPVRVQGAAGPRTKYLAART